MRTEIDEQEFLEFARSYLSEAFPNQPLYGNSGRVETQDLARSPALIRTITHQYVILRSTTS